MLISKSTPDAIVDEYFEGIGVFQPLNILIETLRTGCHCDEGEQDGDDGFLHVLCLSL